jgi:deazaflavin-dependent oxidoreductase (nitroreductase family)
MNPYKAALVRWSHHTSFIPFVKYVATPLDKLTQRAFGRPFSTIGTGVPTMYLTTIGRKSGQERVTPIYGLTVSGGIALINSNAGQEKRPDWYYNLQANPKCRLARGKKPEDYVARPARDDERDEIWTCALKTWPAWQSYDERTDRELDMLVLEKV